MSYNGSGTFQINSSGQPVVTGTVISSTAFNALTADLATGLSTAITKDGQTTTTVRVPFAAGISSTLTTDATSSTTGSIITAGGISCQKALWVGGAATLATPLGPSSGGKPSNRYTNFTNATQPSTGSTTAVMTGFGSSWTLTPTTTGRVRIKVTGSSALSLGSAPQISINLRFGTGTAPSSGAAATGTQMLTSDYYGVSSVNAVSSYGAPICMEAEVTGLTLGTAYWFDATFFVSSGATGYFRPSGVVIEEF